MTRLVPVDRCALRLWSNRRGGLVPVAEHGTPARVLTRLANPNYPGHLAIERRLAAGGGLVTYVHDPDAPDVALGLADLELYALAAIPLGGHGRLVGALVVGLNEPPAFSPAALALARSAARHMGPLIENARLLGKVRKAAAFRAGVAALAAALNAWNDLAVIGRLVCKRGAELFEVSNGVLFRRHDEALRAVVATGPGAQDAVGLALSLNDERDPVVCAFREAHAVFVNDIDPEVGDAPTLARQLGCRSLLAVPLVGVAGTDGCLVYGDADNRHAFGRTLADEGAQLAAIATGAIERGRSAQADEALRVAELHAVKLGRQASELTDSRDAALAAAEAKAEFLANMSHEIRTPMTAILGYLNLVSRADITEGQRRQHLATIRRNGEHLLRILNDILDLSKIEAGKMTIERVACSTADLVGEVVSLMQPRALEKGLVFEVECATPIPETIRVDPTRLRQILINLVSNAIKFTQSGGVRLRLSLSTGAGHARPMISFDVIDTGVGLSAEAMAVLFTPFTQGDASMTRRFGGSGLGLAISARLAQMLGGEITAWNSPCGGSVFSISVEVGPLDGVALRNELVRATEEASVFENDLGPGLQARVLLAEDTPDNQRLFAFYLEKAGVDLEVVDDGEAACERALAAAAEGAPFDVILMDMQMPTLDGEGATRRLRHAGYVGPIVALTAHALQSERERCLRAGCDDFASKPIEPGTLIGIVRRFARPCAASVRHDVSIVSTLDGGAEFGALLDRFVAGLPDRASAIEHDLATGDLRALARHAHQLKGTSGGYGFDPIYEAALRLEESLESGLAPDAIHRNVCEVVELCRRARATAATGATADPERA